MFRDGDQRRIEHTPLGLGGQRSGHEQPEMLGEVD